MVPFEKSLFHVGPLSKLPQKDLASLDFPPWRLDHMHTALRTHHATLVQSIVARIGCSLTSWGQFLCLQPLAQTNSRTRGLADLGSASTARGALVELCPLHEVPARLRDRSAVLQRLTALWHGERWTWGTGRELATSGSEKGGPMFHRLEGC